MSLARPILDGTDDLKPYNKKIPDDAGWYYIALYNPEAKWYEERHIFADNGSGKLLWWLDGKNVSSKELKDTIGRRKQRLYLFGPMIPTTKQLMADAELK